MGEAWLYVEGAILYWGGNACGEASGAVLPVTADCKQ